MKHKRKYEVKVPSRDADKWKRRGKCAAHGIQRPCAEADWTTGCENCGQKPIMCETGMCGPCTTGEAATYGGNW